MNRVLPLVGRLCFVAIFAHSAWGDLHDIHPFFARVAALGLPLPNVAAAVALALLVVGTVSIALGAWARVGGWCFVVFLAAVTPMAHKFWGVPDAMRAMQQEAQFLKNVSLLGAALMIAASGVGPFSLTRK